MDPQKTAPIIILLGSCIVLTVLIYGFSFLLGLLITHKIFGPIVPIQRFLSQIKMGEYSARVHLRDKDEPRMKEIAASLNELAEILESQVKS